MDEHRKSSSKPLGGLIYFKPFEGEGGGLFNLEKTMVLVLHKELEHKSGKAQVQEVGGHAANFCLVKKPSRISPHKVLQS